jgi:hypothetical protein
MTVRRIGAVAVAPVTLVALLSLAGCGGGGSSAAAPSPSSLPHSRTTTTTTTTSAAPSAARSGGESGACKLVTENDASTAIGAPSGAGLLTTRAHGSQCIYGTGALVVTTSDSGKTEYEQGRNAITAAPAGAWSDVSNLGDAGFTSHGGPVVSVEFYKGSTLVSIILNRSTASVPTDAAVTVAHAAADRI